MRTLIIALSILALLLTLVPSMMVLTGNLDLDMNRKLMSLGFVLWFVTAPFWFNEKKSIEAK